MVIQVELRGWKKRMEADEGAKKLARDWMFVRQTQLLSKMISDRATATVQPTETLQMQRSAEIC